MKKYLALIFISLIGQFVFAGSPRSSSHGSGGFPAASARDFPVTIPVTPAPPKRSIISGGGPNSGNVSGGGNQQVPPQSQATLIFEIPSLTFSNGTAILPAASGGSGSGAISYASDTPSICTVSGTTVTAEGIGQCAIVATKAGSDAMGPISARAEFSIAAQPQTSIAFNLSGITWSGSTATIPVATGGSGSGAFNYEASGSCSLSGTTLTKTSAGTCTVTATRTASGIYNASAPVSSTYEILGVPQLTPVNFDISSLTFGNSNTVNLPSASGGDGSGGFTYSTSSSTCTLSANGTTLTRTSVGNCIVTATRAASGIYSAKSVSSTLNIQNRAQTPLVVTMPTSWTNNIGVASVSIGSGGGAITWSSTTTDKCTVGGVSANGLTANITRVAAGNCVVRVTKAGDTSNFYNSASVDTPALVITSADLATCQVITASSCPSGWRGANRAEAQSAACGAQVLSYSNTSSLWLTVTDGRYERGGMYPVDATERSMTITQLIAGAGGTNNNANGTETPRWRAGNFAWGATNYSRGVCIR